MSQTLVIIADDLSGAAESAGVALERGLRAEVRAAFEATSDAEAIAIDTHTRSLPADAAAQRVAEMVRAVVDAGASLVFKKIDSALRGNVLAEACAAIDVGGFDRAVIAAANPSRGRVIRDGVYRIDDRPLHETAFAHDPEHPASTSDVMRRIGAHPRDDTSGWRGGDRLPDARIVIAEHITTTDDLRRLAALMDERTLPIGGHDLLDAVLTDRGLTAHDATRQPGGNADVPPDATLMICGSAAAWRHERARQCADRRMAIAPMPETLHRGDDPSALRQWADHTVAALDANGAAMIAIARTLPLRDVRPADLADRMAHAVQLVVSRRRIGRLVVEGGATAAAVVQRLGWTRMTVIRSHARGVVEMRPADTPGAPAMVLKPGSYPLPEPLWPTVASA